MKSIILLFLFFCVTSIFGQLGPAGVGSTSNNGLWLRASDIAGADGDVIDLWEDKSGNGNDALQTDLTERPQFFNTSMINNQPVLRFDGSNDQMLINDTDILDNSDGLTYYAIVRPNNLNGSPRGILGKRITFTVSVEYAYTWFFWGGNNLYLDIHTQNNRFHSSPTSFSNGQNYMLAFDYDGTAASSQRSRIFSAGDLIKISTEASAAIPNSNQDVAIGGLNVDYGTYLGADYAELIQFNFKLDSIQHIMVSNYLSATYDIGLAVNDIYDEDDAINGNYDFEMAGIGRVDAATQQLDAKGSGIVRISNATDLEDDEYLMWGHDGQEQQASNFTDIPGALEGRLTRVWRVSESNAAGSSVDVGAVKITWDLSDLGPVTASDLRLLIDTDNDGVFLDETPISGAVSEGAGNYSFSNVIGIENNLRFTLGSINIVNTPLPVELMKFNAVLNDKGETNLSWTTSSESNSNYFLVQRSRDGEIWQELDKLKGAGESSIKMKYKTIDEKPYANHTYYRLKQVDFNGDFEYSDVKSVFKDESKYSFIDLYPNPTNGIVTLHTGNGNNTSQVLVFNGIGENVSSQVSFSKISHVKMNIDLSQLAFGTYFIKCNNEVLRVVKQ